MISMSSYSRYGPRPSETPRWAGPCYVIEQSARSEFGNPAALQGPCQMSWSQPVQEGIRIAGGLSLLSLPVVSGGVWDQNYMADAEETKDRIHVTHYFLSVEEDDQGPGYQATKSDTLSKLEHGKEPCITENKIQNRTRPGIGKVDSHLPEHSQDQRFPKSLQQCSEQNAFRKSVHLSKTRLALIQNHTFDLCRKAWKSSLSLVNQKRRYEIKNPVEFNGDKKFFLHGDCEQLYSGIEFPE
eukprot:bmy_19238T0